eukprot:3888349-Lingulodinium_polyedra.AAC.1
MEKMYCQLRARAGSAVQQQAEAQQAAPRGAGVHAPAEGSLGPASSAGGAGGQAAAEVVQPGGECEQDDT